VVIGFRLAGLAPRIGIVPDTGNHITAEKAESALGTWTGVTFPLRRSILSPEGGN
jgi:hypothetical protein